MGLKWIDDYNVGVASIDNQHKELFNRANQLFEAMKSGKGSERAESVLDFLGRYVLDHFREEEQVMARSGFPDLEAHRRSHEAFTQTFRQLVDEFREKGTDTMLSIKIQRTVAGWLIDHIVREDRKVGLHVASKKAA